MEPVEKELVIEREAMTQVEKDELREIGYEKIRDGKVAGIILAGGLGLRLGFTERPKGEFDIGLPSMKSIFQLLVERFLKV